MGTIMRMTAGAVLACALVTQTSAQTLEKRILSLEAAKVIAAAAEAAAWAGMSSRSSPGCSSA